MTDTEQDILINAARTSLAQAERTAILTGAGVSAESGVPTFRGAGGLWRQYRPEDLATPEAFARDPKLVWEWYDWRRQRIAQAAPNPAHRALAQWESRKMGFTLITQNVDGLHERAGSLRVLKLHGDIWEVRCLRCGTTSRDERVPLPVLPPHCTCGGLLRPGVVWFGEMLPEDALQAAWRAAERAQVFLVVGTSALVYPASELPRVARNQGACVIEVNPAITALSSAAHIRLRGQAGALLPRLLDFS